MLSDWSIRHYEQAGEGAGGETLGRVRDKKYTGEDRAGNGIPVEASQG